MERNLIDQQSFFDRSSVATVIFKVINGNELFIHYYNEAFLNLYKNSIYPGENINILLDYLDLDKKEDCLNIALFGGSKSAMFFSQAANRKIIMQYYQIVKDYCACLIIDPTAKYQQEIDYFNLSKEYESILQNIDGGIILLKRFTNEWQFSFVSEGILNLLKMSKEEFMNRSNEDGIFAFVSSKDKDNVIEKFKNIFSDDNNNNARIEFRVNDINEEEIWVLATNNFYVDKDDNYVCCLAITNINDAKISQIKSKKKYDEFQVVVKHIGLVLWEYDINENKLRSLYGENASAEMPSDLNNFPQSFVNLGFVDDESIEDYLQLHRDMKNGLSESSKQIKLVVDNEKSWFLIKYANNYDDNGKPTIAYGTSQKLEMFKEYEDAVSIAANNAGLYIWIYDVINKQIKSSKKMNETYGEIINLIGTEEEKIKSMMSKGNVHPDDIYKYLAINRKMKSINQTFKEVVRKKNIFTKEWDYLECSYTPVFDSNQKLIRIVCSAKNINDLIKNEALYKEFMNYKTVVKDNSVASYSLNLTKNLFINEKDNHIIANIEILTVDDYFGYTSKQLFSKVDYTEYCRMFNRQNLIKLYYEGTTTKTVEYRYNTTSIKTIWLKMTIHMQENPMTKDIEAFVYYTNIDRQKKVENTISKLIDTEYEFICLIDVVSGYTTVLGGKSELNAEERFFDEKVFDEAMKEAYAKETNIQYEIDILKVLNKEEILKQIKEKDIYQLTIPYVKNNERFYTLFKVVYVSDSKQTLLLTRRDVTKIIYSEQEQKEKLRKALFEAEKANQAKSDFLSRMSHDMRTPMNGIIGMLDILSHMSLSSDMMAIVNKMKISGNILLSLINDTLDMNRIESNKTKINLSTIYLKNLLENICLSITPQISSKNITLINNIDNIEAIPILADNIIIQRIILNIITNAIKFTNENGIVEIIAKTSSKMNNTISYEISIKDNGMGISKEFLNHIFEPFAQEENNIKTEYTGTGLGLTIVKKLVDLIGGTIEVISEKNKGTEVRLFFTFTISEEVIINNDEKVDYRVLKGINILLCEDNEINIEIAKLILEEKGCLVTTALNGAIGVEKFNSSAVGYYDCILMDIRMPVMDGLMATKTIRTLNREDALRVPIIALSANAFLEDRERSKEAGMNAHVSKLFNPEFLYRTIIENLVRMK